MEALKELKDFLNGLNEEQLQMKFEDNIFTPDSDENGNVNSLDFKFAKENIYEYGDGFYPESYIEDEIRDEIQDENDLPELLARTLKDLPIKKKVGEILIIANHY